MRFPHMPQRHLRVLDSLVYIDSNEINRSPTDQATLRIRQT